MKKLLITFFAVLFCITSSIGWSANFQKGLAAANKGDFATALLEWTPLAEQGDDAAQYNLGVMYGKGMGVIQDNIYAHMWFNISASNGNKNAFTNRDIMVKRMTPTDISTAQKLARECIEKKYKGC